MLNHLQYHREKDTTSMRQVSLVALYGSKPPEMTTIIAAIQHRLHNIFKSTFQPYTMEQIHATIVSLERVAESTMINLCMAHHRPQQQPEPMDFAGLLHFLCAGNWFPFNVQIGGFQDCDYSFTSRSKRPYERSFGIFNGRAIAIGFPLRFPSLPLAHAQHQDTPYCSVLARIRKGVETFHILHKYHTKPDERDNDFYFRVGLIQNATISASHQQAAEQSIRTYLSTVGPMTITINAADIYVVAYEHETLPIASTTARPVCDAHITPDYIRNLYTKEEMHG